MATQTPPKDDTEDGDEMVEVDDGTDPDDPRCKCNILNYAACIAACLKDKIN